MAKYYYNGVLLPEIPADVLASYPYCWIRKNTTSGNYDLFFSTEAFYAVDSDSISGSGISKPWYIVQMASVESIAAWEYSKETTANLAFDSNRTILWSNHDIPNGSATSTEMYFMASPIMPEDRPTARLEYVKSIGYSYLNTGIIPDANTEAEVTYAVDACSIYGCHMLSNSQWYFPFSRTYGGTPHFFAYNMGGAQVNIPMDDVLSTKHTIRAYPNGNIIIDGKIAGNAAAGSATSTEPLYLLAYGGAPSSINYTGTSRLYRCKIWQSGELVRNYVPYCQMGVPGLKEMVSGQFYPSEGTLAFSAGSFLSEYKYIIRSGATLYTVTDGALSALTETEITTALFQTYGVDDLPDGSLLVNLIDPEVLCWQDSKDELPELTLSITGSPPAPQTIITNTQDMSDSTILGIEGIQAVCSDDILFALSFDDEATWKAYDGTTWITLDLPNTGMTKTTMESIGLEAWAEVVTSDHYKVRFILPATTSYMTSMVVNYIN